jgi:hypothetical protein
MSIVFVILAGASLAALVIFVSDKATVQSASEVYELGSRAQAAGLNAEANPFGKYQTQSSIQWFLGYLEAAEKAKGIKR